MKIIARIGVVGIILVGIGCIVDAVAERTAERIIDKLADSGKIGKKYDDIDDDILEPDDII